MTVLFLNTFHHILFQQLASIRIGYQISSPNPCVSQVVDAGLGQLAFYNTNLQSYMEMTDKAGEGFRCRPQFNRNLMVEKSHFSGSGSTGGFFPSWKLDNSCVDCCVDKLTF